MKKDAFHPGNKVRSFVILKIADINLGLFISIYSCAKLRHEYVYESSTCELWSDGGKQ